MPGPRTTRLIAIVSAGIIVIAAAFAYLYLWQSHPIGTGPAGPQIVLATFSKEWSDKSFVLVGLGDSVTAGFGARHGYSYFDLLNTNSPDEFEDMKGKCLQSVLPNLQYTNLAVSGSTSGELIAHQLPRLPKVGSNTMALIVVTTGGNDLIHNYGRTPPREEAMFGATWEQASPWVTNFEQRLDGLMEQLNAHFPAGCHIFIADIFDPTDEVGDSEHAGLPAWKDAPRILAAYNDVIHRCPGKHHYVHVVDLHGAFLGHGIHCTQFWRRYYDSKDPHYWYFSNLEDPNERGYDVIRRLFLLEIARDLNQLK